MLTHLQIRDLAIVDAAELEWHGGFTALTGETGAGKSILIDALLLATGARADSGAIRHNAERAEVSATFDVASNRAARAWLEEQSIEVEREVVLRRVITADGRGRAYINGQTVPAQSLRALGELLIDIHGQLEFQTLVRRARQRELLDGYGELDGLLREVASLYHVWRDLDARQRELEARLRDRDARMDLLGHYVGELDALDPQEGEVETLHAERTRITSLSRLAEGAARAGALLDADEDGALATLARAQGLVRGLLPLDAALTDTERALAEAHAASREASAALARYVDRLESDPERQEWIESRLAALEGVARKHRCDATELPALRTTLQAELAELRNIAESGAALERQLTAAHRDYVAAAARLTEARQQAARRLDKRVATLLGELGMQGARFVTQIESATPPQLSEAGNDDVEFRIGANAGEPPRPLAKVASGGELSRVSLALQVATLQGAHLPCLVFDEVDAGVGGAVAESVGRLLAQLASRAQVLCVTHLPQVAAQAHQQVRVAKLSQAGRTRTLLTPLSQSERTEEIARMLGGATITDRTREHAREMLEAAAGTADNEATSRPVRGAGSSRGRSGRARSASGR